MTIPPPTPREAYGQRWGFLLDQLCREQRDISHAVAVSGDGLLIASSGGLPRNLADHLSAVTSGMSALTASNARMLGAGEVTETVVGMTGGHLVIMAIDDNATLTVLASPESNMGAVAHAMGRLIGQSGEVLAPPSRRGA